MRVKAAVRPLARSAQLDGPATAGEWRWLDSPGAVKALSARAQGESTASVLSFMQLPAPAAALADGRLGALRSLAEGLPPTFFCKSGSGQPVVTTDI